MKIYMALKKLWLYKKNNLHEVYTNNFYNIDDT